ncbi:hypothetical protein BDZ89DRAFT_1047630 [Hymenopellis radicata]|nr:hypothetical protein BDZ89DRAFT_1047630 [Hymenopellis radicata]
MSVPEGFSILNLSGTFTSNNTLSDSMDEILSLQGVSWIKRKAISAASVTLHIKHYTDADGIERIDIERKGPGGNTTTEDRVLTWTDKHADNPLLGPVIAKSRRVKIDELSGADFLKTGWTDETLEHGLIQLCVQSEGKTSWVLVQTWGIEAINGGKYYTRHLHYSGSGKVAIVRQVYDYVGN